MVGCKSLQMVLDLISKPNMRVCLVSSGMFKWSPYLYNPRNFELKANNIYMVRSRSLQNGIKIDH